jgi:Uma2 family endonuclease
MTTLQLQSTRLQPELEKVWTQEEFHRLPEGPPYYELDDGELIEMVRPRGRHQKIVGKLFAVLSPYVEQNRLGDVWPEVEVDLSLTRTYVPDLSYLHTANLHRFANDIVIDGPPDLVVEVTSPGTAGRDKSRKLRAYYLAGVPWYWLVETDSLVIYEYRHTEEGYLLAQIIEPFEAFTPGIFPGLTFNLAELLGEQIVEENPHE